jgi:poly(A) polymerase Pap1
MSDKPTKTYVDAIFIKERKIGEDGKKLAISIQCKDFFEFAKKYKNEGGWLNIDVLERKTPSEKGHTHYAQLDTWKPKEQGEAKSEAKPAAKREKAPEKTPAPAPDEEQPPF